MLHRLPLLLLLSASSLSAQPSGSAVQTNNEFAFKFFQQAERKKPNFCVSPYSITSAFAMCYAGAAGETQKEFQQVFGFGANNSATHQAFGKLQADLLARNNPGVQFALANRLFPDAKYAFSQDYLDGVQKHYGASLKKFNYRSAYEPARKEINKWVEAQTHERIKDLLPQGALSAQTRLVLVNTLFIKGAWEAPFEAEATRTAAFTDDAGVKTNVRMMSQTYYFNYAQDKEFQVLELPFKGDSLAMLFILPKTGLTLDGTRASLTKEWYEKTIAGMHSLKVVCNIPKFKTECDLQLNKTLKRMGLNSAFTEYVADFSGMDPAKQLYISAAFHKTFVEVDEKGAEAAAATAIDMAEPCSVIAAPPVFNADHPFFYILRDKITGTVLFIGEMKEPTPAVR